MRALATLLFTLSLVRAARLVIRVSHCHCVTCGNVSELLRRGHEVRERGAMLPSGNVVSHCQCVAYGRWPARVLLERNMALSP